MKIGIITVYDAMNYGSYLQAYALQKYLKKKGHDAVFLKWRHGGWARNSVMLPVLYRRNVSMRGIRAGIGRIQSFDSVKGSLPETDSTDGLELLIIGSDTLWDAGRKMFRNPILYGKTDADIPLIAYAVSCGNSVEEDFNKYRKITANITRIQKISVRDAHTRSVLEKSMGIKAELVCDPTMLLKEDEWPVQKCRKDLSDVILVYTYGLPEHIIRHLKRYAKEKRLRLVSLCMYQPWCDAHLNCQPLQFSSVLKSASHVVTNTFHGTVFSVLSQSRLISIANGQKLKCLIESLFPEDISLCADACYKQFADHAEHGLDDLSCQETVKILREKSCSTLNKMIGSVAGGLRNDESS